MGLSVLEFLEERRPYADGDFIFTGLRNSPVFGAFPHHWDRIFKNSALDGVTAHVLRHSFASLANDLGFTEVTIAALVGHAKGSVTSKYIHTLDTTLVMAADTIQCAVTTSTARGRRPTASAIPRRYSARGSHKSCGMPGGMSSG